VSSINSSLTKASKELRKEGVNIVKGTTQEKLGINIVNKLKWNNIKNKILYLHILIKNKSLFADIAVNSIYKLDTGEQFIKIKQLDAAGNAIVLTGSPNTNYLTKHLYAYTFGKDTSIMAIADIFTNYSPV
jgi:hypothetical protein